MAYGDELTFTLIIYDPLSNSVVVPFPANTATLLLGVER